MKRRSFIQMLAAIPAAVASLKVSAQDASLKAAPFVLPPEKPPVAAVLPPVPDLELPELLKQVYDARRYDLNDDITRKTIIFEMRDVCLSFQNQRKLYDFLIVCDASNNTASDIVDRNLNVDVFLCLSGHAGHVHYRYDIWGMHLMSPPGRYVVVCDEPACGSK
jgi:hypothetical protein